MRQPANPIEQIVAKFGGQTAMARKIGVGQTSVWEWIEKGLVPSRRIPQIIEAGRRLDPPLLLTANDFFVISRSGEGS